MSEQIEWEGYVERITFRNEENGYTVLFLVDAEEEEEVCCVGQFSYVAEGLYLKVTGREVIHKNYGPQIQVDSYEEKQPKDSVAVERYLGDKRCWTCTGSTYCEAVWRGHIYNY